MKKFVVGKRYRVDARLMESRFEARNKKLDGKTFRTTKENSAEVELESGLRLTVFPNECLEVHSLC